MAKQPNIPAPDSAEEPEVQRHAPVDPTVARIDNFVKKNRNWIFGGLLLIVGGGLAIWWWTTQKQEESQQAQIDIYPAQYFFSKDSLDLARYGDGISVIGFEEIADRYEGTKAGNLSRYYLGAIALKQGEFDEAIAQFGQFESDDAALQGWTYCLMGDAASELKDYTAAAEHYTKAADYDPNKYLTPRYLLQLALVQEADGNGEGAKGAYQRLIDEFPTTQEAQKARKYLALLGA